jgi:hypothetical protein
MEVQRMADQRQRFEYSRNKFPTAEKQVFYNIWLELVEIRELLERVHGKEDEEIVEIEIKIPGEKEVDVNDVQTLDAGASTGSARKGRPRKQFEG